MKAIQLSRDIVPLTHLKTHASEIFRQLRSDHRPVVITQNGRAAGVLLAPEDFDRLQERDLYLSAIREGLADAAAGHGVDDEELARELDEEFGPLE